jgi:hypothetical protein
MNKDFALQLKDLENTCKSFIEQMKSLWGQAESEEEKQDVMILVEKIFGATPRDMMWFDYFDREHVINHLENITDTPLTVKKVSELVEALNSSLYFTNTDEIGATLEYYSNK